MRYPRHAVAGALQYCGLVVLGGCWSESGGEGGALFPAGKAVEAKLQRSSQGCIVRSMRTTYCTRTTYQYASLQSVLRWRTRWTGGKQQGIGGMEAGAVPVGCRALHACMGCDKRAGSCNGS